MNLTFFYKSHLCLLFESLEMNLRELIKQKTVNGAPLSTVRTYAKQILLGFIFIHENKLIHSDCISLIT